MKCLQDIQEEIRGNGKSESGVQEGGLSWRRMWGSSPRGAVTGQGRSCERGSLEWALQGTRGGRSRALSVPPILIAAFSRKCF